MSNSNDTLCIDTFKAICESAVRATDYPHAKAIVSGVPVYSGDTLREAIAGPDEAILKAELAAALSSGPGVFAIEKAYADNSAVDEMSDVFEQLLAQQRGSETADHFAAAGANGRIWNAFEKSALHYPATFIEYYKNPVLQLVSEAWLGPHYQITAQLNVVYPGGAAQQPHRDYHLGFQENSEVACYPLHAQRMSAYLTLQGGVAHCDMPIESGPTQLLPHSQRYEHGYRAWREPAFKDYFAEHSVQLPLQKGDALFFNPALFHAAGANRSADIARSVNLLQISSAFAKPMETVDRYRICETLYPQLLQRWQSDTLSEVERQALLSACCDGYSFPSNLDTDPPRAAMAPQTQAELTAQALTQSWSCKDYVAALHAHRERRYS